MNDPNWAFIGVGAGVYLIGYVLGYWHGINQ